MIKIIFAEGKYRFYDKNKLAKFQLIQNLLDSNLDIKFKMNLYIFDALYANDYNHDIETKIELTYWATYLCYDIPNLFMEFKNMKTEELKKIFSLKY